MVRMTALSYAIDWCPDNDDEALTALAKEIYTLNELFTSDEMKFVLPILKHLATTEEVVVRDAVGAAGAGMRIRLWTASTRLWRTCLPTLCVTKWFP